MHADDRPLVHSPLLLRLHADWQRWRAGRELPARRDFEPWDIAYVLGCINLVEASYEPLRFRYRVYSTELAWRLGRDLNGRYVDEHADPQIRAHVQSRYALAVETRGPAAEFHERTGPGARLHHYEALVLPLSNDGSRIDMLLAGFVFLDPQTPA